MYRLRLVQRALFDLFEKSSDLFAGHHRRGGPPRPLSLAIGRWIGRLTVIARDLNDGHGERRLCDAQVVGQCRRTDAQHGGGQLRGDVEIAVAVALPAADHVHGFLQRVFHPGFFAFGEGEVG